MPQTYVLRGGPNDGQRRACESTTLEVYAPRWSPLGCLAVSTTTIPVAIGRYEHNGRNFSWIDGHRIPAMDWRGFTS